MPRKKSLLKILTALTWDDLADWAGSRTMDRGRRYQRQGRVKDLAAVKDEALVAWVDGSQRYATKIVLDFEGDPNSICSCPIGFDCKHGVAVVLAYLAQIENDQPIARARPDDERFDRLADLDEFGDEEQDDNDEFALPAPIRQDIDVFLKNKTKAQLVDLILEFAGQYPGMAQELADRKQLKSGNFKSITERLRREIQEIGAEPGWQNYWRNEGYTPDYSGIRSQLENLLAAGQADTVVQLGQKLVTTGCRQVEESHDEGETGMEVASCMPIIVDALDRSSLDAFAKLNWAIDAVLADQFGICEVFADYLNRRHPKSAWRHLADRLLERLEEMQGPVKANDFSRRYARDQLSNWVIHALEQAGRKDEIIPLCEREAQLTGNYRRLVERLITARRYPDAERWIDEGIRETKDKWPGIVADLRKKLQKIRSLEKNWSAVAAMQVEAFVRRPSPQTFADCQKAAVKIKAWPKVRRHLLHYLEKGELPWKQKKWPLPESGGDPPSADPQQSFPLISHLIDIAIFEKKPDQVLKWFDQRPPNRFARLGIDTDAIAVAVQNHAPERAVAIWQAKAEGLIAVVKPSAYQDAAVYLKKAAKVMQKLKKKAAWEQYLRDLRTEHARKRRLIEILDTLGGKPIIKQRRLVI